MDWKTFLVRLVEAVAWPAVVAFAFWNTRDRIASLFTRVTKLKWKDAEATFAEKLDRAEEALPNPLPKDAVAPSVEFQMKTIDIAEVAPGYVITEAWMNIESALLEAATKKGLVNKIEASPSNRRMNPLLLARQLELPIDELRILDELRVLRNRAVHERDAQPTPTDALRYRDLAERLVQDIRKRGE